MSKGSGLTRGDARRNARKAALRAVVPDTNAVIGLDLGEKKQALVACGADGQVLARRSPKAAVHALGVHLEWAAGRAAAAGFAGVTVACEPTGSRWMVVQELCRQRGYSFVCIQPLVSHVAREQQDLTGDKTDEADCELIARLARGLYCYVPEVLDPAWAELRAAGRDRAAQITRATAAKQLIRDQLALVAPGLLQAHCDPLESATWLACLEVVTQHGAWDELAAAGWGAFAAAAAAKLPGWGGRRLGASAAKVLAALAGPVPAPRMVRAVRRRIAGALEDLRYARARRARTEAEMTAMLGELGIDCQRVCEIPGLTPAGLAAIVAETGDLHRYESSSSLVKHAGMSPARNESGAFAGLAKISRRGRPGLRLAAWRATWAVLRHCDVLAAKHAALTSRGEPAGRRLADAQARVACAASLLRWIYSLIVHGTCWDPAIAAGQLGHHHAIAA